MGKDDEAAMLQRVVLPPTRSMLAAVSRKAESIGPAPDADDPDLKADCHKGFEQFCADGRQASPYCTSQLDTAMTNYAHVPATPDLMAMLNFVTARPRLPVGNVLVVGIGNSKVASVFFQNGSSRVDGITISPAEKQYAVDNYPEALKLGRYRVILGNKYNPRLWSSLRSNYDLILDNNLASFAYCPSFYRGMIKSFISRLAPDGRLLTADPGMSWAMDWGYKLTGDSLTRIANESFGTVASDLVQADACPDKGCRVYSVLPLQVQRGSKMSQTCSCVFFGDDCPGGPQSPVPRVKYDYDAFAFNASRTSHRWAQQQPLSVLQVPHAKDADGDVESSVLQHWHSRNLEKGEDVVYLTMDDGFHCEDVACSKHLDFLDLLDYLGVKMTVFVIGKTLADADHTVGPCWALKNNATGPCKDEDVQDQEGPLDMHTHYRKGAQAMMKEYSQRGHTLGSHTYNHLDLSSIPLEDAMADVRKNDELIRNYTNHAVKHFRAPYLATTSEVLHFLVHSMNYEVWDAVNHGGSDWNEWEDPYSIVNYEDRVGSHSHGAVIDVHDRPHVLHDVKLVVGSICKACPQCKFEALD